MDKCQKCSLGNKEKRFDYYYNENSKYLILSDFPETIEIRSGIPKILQGQSSYLFKKMIKKANLQIKDFSYATLTQCYPTTKNITDTNTKESINTCVQANLYRFIKKVNPEIIFITKDVCATYFFNLSSLNSLGNSLKYWEGFKVLALELPSTTRRKKYSRINSVANLKYAKSLIEEDNSLNHLDLNTVSNTKEFYKSLEKIKNGNAFNRYGVDVETTGLNPYKGDKIFGISFAFSDTEAYYFPIRRHSILGNGYELYWPKKEMEKLRKFVEDRNNKFSFHFSNFDVEFIHIDLGWDIKVTNDSLNLAYTLNENRKKSLEYLTNRFFSDLVGFKEKSKKEIKQTKDFDKIPLNILAERCNIDSIACFRLTNKFVRELFNNNQELLKYYNKFRKPLLNILINLQENGFKIDLNRLEELDKKYSSKLNRLKTKMWKAANCRFNPKSNPELRDVLYNKINLTPPKGFITEKTKKPQLNKAAFKELKKEYGLLLIDYILDYKELHKLKSTYIDGFRKVVVNTRIHSKFKSAVAKTGRLASSNPNAQNIAGNKDIKGLIIAEEGYNIIEMDYKQAEARLFAYLSGSDKLAEACYSSDVYQKIAALSTGVDFEEVTQEVRDHYKMVVLALLYGMGDASLAKIINKTKRQAESLRNQFFDMFPAVVNWKQKIYKELKENGYVTSIYGRRRRIPTIYSNKEEDRAEAKRQAVNFKVQSPTFDYVGVGLQRTYKNIQPFDAKIILTVHDSILVEVKKEQTEDILPIMKKSMIDPVPPIDKDAHMGVDAEVGKRWGFFETVEI
ncbi:MAG: hypothetical protein K9K32_00225 [Halanaerobiales bacterium]|nr:hypothetical protein [Halanaerobiales bacterium]